MISDRGLDGVRDCQFAVLRTILAECMPHLLSFGALSPRTAQIH